MATNNSAVMVDSNSGEETFTASRWTKGNLFFPTQIVVNSLRVSRVKRRLFGKTEESISISQVASVKISTGMLWSDIRIESTGGTDPIESHGHRKADAVRIRDLIESLQARRGDAEARGDGDPASLVPMAKRATVRGGRMVPGEDAQCERNPKRDVIAVTSGVVRVAAIIDGVAVGYWKGWLPEMTG